MLDVTVSRVLYFERFSLDLARGCLRMGDQALELRPKTFEVLKFLAMNAGHLVAKQELYDAVWPNVIVSDDSIAQCIRELRSKLGDTDHSLIKTMSRRGYLLDTVVTTEAPPSIDTGDKSTATPPHPGSTSRHSGMSPVHGPRPRKLRDRRHSRRQLCSRIAPRPISHPASGADHKASL